MEIKAKPYLKMIITGILSIGAYVLLFENIQIAMEYFTRGGKYAGLIIITAFIFSFIHGAFASNTLEVLGLKAKAAKH